MSSKDEQPTSAPDVTTSPVVVPVTDVPAGVRVHHFDELSEQTQHALATVSHSGRLDIDPTATRLSRGDVVVFTEYFRVQ
ncbi:hypothetical protein [Haloferax profundi]|uniref:Uncharacterized protein n=1 Tax=Haloferax profundi TaxID=1544718 RepID=A0A0W1SQ04_9EURY|nr:hypothetical protein [Haloferax profundi]KTG28447.1 hypothetical protein AUR66_11675 [Haloferax profundi]